jgi:hypothetical protein
VIAPSRGAFAPPAHVACLKRFIHLLHSADKSYAYRRVKAHAAIARFRRMARALGPEFAGVREPLPCGSRMRSVDRREEVDSGNARSRPNYARLQGFLR